MILKFDPGKHTKEIQKRPSSVTSSATFSSPIYNLNNDDVKPYQNNLTKQAQLEEKKKKLNHFKSNTCNVQE